MSELNKHSLTSIGTNKKDKKCKTERKTVRLDVTLSESNEEQCPILNYRDLLISAEKKKNRLKRAEGGTNGFNPPSAEDAAVVRRLEAKYGDGGKKKLGRLEDFADLGAGYDETDPFIDNTDAYDEHLPEQMTTACGGFYINSGSLEFNRLSDQSDADEPVGRVKRSVKRVVSEDEEDDEDSQEDEVQENGMSSSKRSKSEAPPAGGERDDLVKKRKFSQDRELLKKRKKRAIEDLNLKKKAATTVKDLLKEKRETLEMSSEGQVQASVLDAIEAVVKADQLTNDSATVTLGGKSPVGSGVNSESDGSMDSLDRDRKEDAQLPDNLPEPLKEVIGSLKKAAKSSAEGKCRFFSANINQLLLRLEQLLCGVTSQTRHQVYAHLTYHLPCSKLTLMKRAKKQHLAHEEAKLADPMRRLKAAVDLAMPAVMDNYTKQSQAVVEQKSTEELSADAEGKPTPLAPKIPRKKFPWTPELLGLLGEIVAVKTRCLELVNSRREHEGGLHDFLDKDVKALWPPGWMTLAQLVRESSKTSPLLHKLKKQRSELKKAAAAATAKPFPVPSYPSTPANPAASSLPPSRPKPPLLLNGTTITAVASTSSKPVEPDRTMTLTPLYETPPVRPSVVEKSNSLDLSNGVSRTTTVIVPTSPMKNVSSSLNPPAAMSLKIPDCISVTPSSAVSPPRKMSLKQQIRDAGKSLPSPAGLMEMMKDANKLLQDVGDHTPKPRRPKKPKDVVAIQPRLMDVVPVHPRHLEELPRIMEAISEAEETDAATNFISQIVDESFAPSRVEAPAVAYHHQDKRKEEIVKDPVKEECDRVADMIGALAGGLKSEPEVPTCAFSFPKAINSIPFAPPRRGTVGFQDAFHKHLIKSIPDIDGIPVPFAAADVDPMRGGYKYPVNYSPSMNAAELSPAHRYTGRPLPAANSPFHDAVMHNSQSGTLPNGLQYSPIIDDPFTLLPALNYSNTLAGNNSRHSPST